MRNRAKCRDSGDPFTSHRHVFLVGMGVRLEPVRESEVNVLVLSVQGLTEADTLQSIN